jgi:hypothetical protein
LLYGIQDVNGTIPNEILLFNIKFHSNLLVTVASDITNIVKMLVTRNGLITVGTSSGDFIIFDRNFDVVFQNKKQNSSIVSIVECNNNVIIVGFSNGFIYVHATLSSDYKMSDNISQVVSLNDDIIAVSYRHIPHIHLIKVDYIGSLLIIDILKFKDPISHMCMLSNSILIMSSHCGNISSFDGQSCKLVEVIKSKNAIVHYIKRIDNGDAFVVKTSTNLRTYYNMLYIEL